MKELQHKNVFLGEAGGFGIPNKEILRLRRELLPAVEAAEEVFRKRKKKWGHFKINK